MAFFKARPRSEVIRQKLADRRSKIPAAEAQVQQAALAVETDGAGDETAYFAAVSELNDLRTEIERLEHALTAALDRETKELEDARTSQELAEALKRAEVTRSLHRGALTDLSNWRRALAPVPGLCTRLALAFAGAEKAARSYCSKIPDNAPDDPDFERFGPTGFCDLIADELARAGKAADVGLPGAADDPAATTFADEVQRISDHRVGYAKRVIVDGERRVEIPSECRELHDWLIAADPENAPPPLPEFFPKWTAAGCPPVPKMERVRERPHYDVPPLMAGQGPHWVLDEITGRARPPTKAEIAEQYRGKRVYLDEPLPPPGSPQSPVGREQANAGRGASAAFYAAAGFNSDGSPLRQSAPPPVPDLVPAPTEPGAAYTPASDYFDFADARREMAAASRRLTGDNELLVVADEQPPAVAVATSEGAATLPDAGGTPAPIAATADPPSTEGAGAPEDAAAVTDTPNPDTAPSGVPARRLGGFTRR